MRELSLEKMEDLLLAHEIAELEQDIDATMATVVPDPHYELAALGWAIDGQAAVREMYRRILPTNERDVAARKLDGKRITGLYLVMLVFDPELELIAGERMYMDPHFGTMMAEQLGPDFGDVPGVSKISDNAPIIALHDAYDVAAEQGLTIKPTR